MDRIGPAGGTPLALLSNGQYGRQDENLGTGTEGTLDPSLYSNALQEEIMYLLSQAGITPNINNWTQVYQALLVIFATQLNAVVNLSGFASFYFSIPVPGGAPLIIQGMQVEMAAGVASQSYLLPTTFQSGFGGGLFTDGGSQAYGWGVAAGVDLSHVTIFCPLTQIIFGSLATRESAAGFAIIWGQ